MPYHFQEILQFQILSRLHSFTCSFVLCSHVPVRALLCASAHAILKDAAVMKFEGFLLPAHKTSYSGTCAAPCSESGFVLTHWTTRFHLPLLELKTHFGSSYGWDKRSNNISYSWWILEYINTAWKKLFFPPSLQWQHTGNKKPQLWHSSRGLIKEINQEFLCQEFLCFSPRTYRINKPFKKFLLIIIKELTKIKVDIAFKQGTASSSQLELCCSTAQQ